MHWNPVVYQKQFASILENSLIYREKINGNTTTRQTIGLGGHKQFKMFHKNKNDKIYYQKTENYHKQLEDHYVEVLNKFKTQTADINDIIYLFKFFLCMKYRNPNILETFVDTCGKELSNEKLNDFIYNGLITLGQPVIINDVISLKEKIKNILNPIQLWNDKQVNPISDITINLLIKNKYWIIFYNRTNIPFLSSDSPIVNLNGGEYCFPLSKDVMLYISNKCVLENNWLVYSKIIDSSIINQFNTFQVNQYQRYLFGGESIEWQENYVNTLLI